MSLDEQRRHLVRAAKSQLGVPYWWGHQVPNYAPVNNRCGFDCSNFTSWVYRTALGIRFSSSSRRQRSSVGRPVPLDQLKVGDLLFFKTSKNPTGGSHVGMYIGRGQAIQEGRAHGKVTIVDLGPNTKFGRNLVFARRVLP
jgi:cell wall-associated NlpC family hydrolase